MLVQPLVQPRNWGLQLQLASGCGRRHVPPPCTAAVAGLRVAGLHCHAAVRPSAPCRSPTKVSPSITIKEECVLLNIGGVRGEAGQLQ